MTFTGNLLPYQPEAVDAMCKRGSMLVAYDLGLGKTVLTIAAIERLMDEESIQEPGLVIALSSLKYQWAESIKQFSNSTPFVIDGTPKQRQAQYQQAFDWKNTHIDYVILNYEQVVNDWQHVKKLAKGFVVLDEATAIKSFKSKRSKHVKKLESPIRFALTGTPIENGRPEELFSIMQFVDPSVLGRFDHFDQAFIVRNPWGSPERYRNLDVFHRRMTEASVRKAQSDPDVAPYLPDTIHLVPLRVYFDQKTANLYNVICTDLQNDLDEVVSLFGSNFNLFSHYGLQSDQGGDADQMRGRLMAKISAMRMLCDHPDLLRKSAAEYAAVTGSGSQYLHELFKDGFLDDVKATPKLDALVTYVSEFLDSDPDNKAVIFSVFVPVLDAISARLGKYGTAMYSGKLNARQKEASKVRFQTDPKTRLLVSSDAGGYGVDLPQANLLVNYDLPWSSGAATQRNGRIRRASSEWQHIVIQDILIAGSIEERQHAMLQQKNSVAAAVIDGEGINDKGGVDLTVGSLRSFLSSNTV